MSFLTKINVIATSMGQFLSKIPVNYNRFFPVFISLIKSATKTTPDHTRSKEANITSEHKEKYVDAPADYISRTDPALELDNITSVVTPNYEEDMTPDVDTTVSLALLVSGAVADDGGVLTNETTAAQNATVNDMTLLPVTPALNDAYDFGFLYNNITQLNLNIGINGVGSWTVTWYYWNGAWIALSPTTDEISGFIGGIGIKRLIWADKSADWVLSTISGLNLYWIRAQVTAYASKTTQPKGTQAWGERSNT